MTDVVDDAGRHRLLLTAEDGSEAELVYRRDGERLYLIHTEVPAAFRGQGTGGRLVTAALDVARRDSFTIVPWCPFARRWLDEHPDAGAEVSIDWSEPSPETEHG